RSSFTSSAAADTLIPKPGPPFRPRAASPTTFFVTETRSDKRADFASASYAPSGPPSAGGGTEIFALDFAFALTDSRFGGSTASTGCGAGGGFGALAIGSVTGAGSLIVG